MGHYCNEHKEIFFHKGAMKGYAHPIGETGKWCNEPEGGGDEMPELPPSVKATGHDMMPPAEDPHPPAPQAVGMWTKEIGDMIRAKYLVPIFGAEISNELIRWYRRQALEITRIPFDGKNLPKFE